MTRGEGVDDVVESATASTVAGIRRSTMIVDGRRQEGEQAIDDVLSHPRLSQIRCFARSHVTTTPRAAPRSALPWLKDKEHRDFLSFTLLRPVNRSPTPRRLLSHEDPSRTIAAFSSHLVPRGDSSAANTHPADQ